MDWQEEDTMDEVRLVNYQHNQHSREEEEGDDQDSQGYMRSGSSKVVLN
jgi:hypothetical protein